MGVSYFPNRIKRMHWCARVQRQGTRVVRWCRTEEEARELYNSWIEQLESMYGPDHKKQYVDGLFIWRHKRSRKENQKTRETAPAACGLILETPVPKRCADFLDCPHYEECLDVAWSKDWQGWVRA